MSQTFSIVCHDTKQKVWIGQGWRKMTSLYTGEADTMKRLKGFLNATMGKRLEFICDDHDGLDCEYEEFGEETS